MTEVKADHSRGKAGANALKRDREPTQPDQQRGAQSKSSGGGNRAREEESMPVAESEGGPNKGNGLAGGKARKKAKRSKEQA